MGKDTVFGVIRPPSSALCDVSMHACKRTSRRIRIFRDALFALLLTGFCLLLHRTDRLMEIVYARDRYDYDTRLRAGRAAFSLLSTGHCGDLSERDRRELIFDLGIQFRELTASALRRKKVSS